MPYCPTCKQEYAAGTTECEDCKTKLVAELPFQAVSSEGTTWVEITSTGTDDEARLIKGFLDAEGIPAQIENVKFTAEPVNFGTMGDIRIYVAAEDERRPAHGRAARPARCAGVADASERPVLCKGWGHHR